VSARHLILEVNLLGGLRDLASQPGPHHLIAPAGHEEPAALQRLLRQESQAYHDVELEIGKRRLKALESARIKRKDEPGEAFLQDAAAAQLQALIDHKDALDHLATEVEAVLAAYQLHPRQEMAELRDGDGLVVELFSDGWTRALTKYARAAARREHLGLPSERDWIEREGV
jgi:hypothetical protein